jgi:hypothetical protein
MNFCTEFLGSWWSHGKFRTAYTTYAAALKTTTHPKTRCRNPYAETQHLILLMMGVFTRNLSSKEYINKITCLIKLAFQIISLNVTVTATDVVIKHRIIALAMIKTNTSVLH